MLSINEYKCVQLTKKQSMTLSTMEEALDALASVFMSCLDWVGETLAMGVEASGQSSAHSNILDCLHAIKQCTVRTVQHVHMDVLLNSDGRDDNNNNNNPNDTPVVTNSNNMNSGDSSNNAFQMDPTEVTSWICLAAFCFVPNWDKSMKG